MKNILKQILFSIFILQIITWLFFNIILINNVNRIESSYKNIDYTAKYKTLVAIEMIQALNNIEMKHEKTKPVQKELVTEKTINISKINPNSPLVGYEQLFIDHFNGDIEKAKLMIAISGAESSLGIHSYYYNYFGVYNSKQGNFNWGWSTTEEGIKESLRLVGYHVETFDSEITEANLNNHFTGGQGKYCQSACTSWGYNTLYYYNRL